MLGCGFSQIIVDLRPTDPDSLPDTALPEPGPAMVAVYEEPESNLGDLPDEETREGYHSVIHTTRNLINISCHFQSDCIITEELGEAKAVRSF